MNTPTATISVCATPESACLRITGRATFQCSPDFRKAITDLAQAGRRAFSLDLEKCLSMDSTFLGVMIGLRNGRLIPNTPVTFGFIKPPQRILDVLSSLGVASLFHTEPGDGWSQGTFAPLSPPPEAKPQANKVEMSRMCLEAHETLMAANPANVPKFKDVTNLMKEELKKLEDEQKPQP